MAVQYSAITTLWYNGCITVAHRIMLNAVNSNPHRAHMLPLHLEDMCEYILLSEQHRRNIESLPLHFVTGQERIKNSRYQSEPEHPSMLNTVDVQGIDITKIFHSDRLMT